MRTATPTRQLTSRSTGPFQRAFPTSDFRTGHFLTSTNLTPANAQARREQHLSLLAELRSVTPLRSLHLAEALRVAELQANKLRAHFDADEAIMPSEAVTSQPRMRVVLDAELEGRASGSSHWNGTSWVIALNEHEPLVRRRFSLFHEYKHIVDDRFRLFLYQAEGSLSSAEKAERVADYFAACVLMPKRLVKRHYCSGVTNLVDLAGMFDVSEKAMSVRLAALGLRAESTGRESRADEKQDAVIKSTNGNQRRTSACTRGRTS